MARAENSAMAATAKKPTRTSISHNNAPNTEFEQAVTKQRKRARLSLDDSERSHSRPASGAEGNDAGEMTQLMERERAGNKRRRKTIDVDPLHQTEEEPRAGHLALEPRIRRISKQVVDARWGPLPESAQKQVKDLFSSVERPVVMRIPDGKKRQEARTALGSVLKRLNARVPRMPFPPTTKDTHFNYEKLLDLNRTLESQLTSTIHSTSLLINDIDKEEQMLANDVSRLRELEEELVGLEHQRSEQTKRTNPLLSQAQQKPVEAEILSQASFIPNSQKSGSIAKESSLVEVAEQVKSHLLSMQSNAAQVKGINGEITRTRAAVDEVIYRELKPQSYAALIHSGRIEP